MPTVCILKWKKPGEVSASRTATSRGVPSRLNSPMLIDFSPGFSSRMSRSRKGDFNLVEKSVFIVHLRRPKSKCDPRSDPFWEFGSFGMTGCHASNLMNPRNAQNLECARLAFVQGGPKGMRLVYLTPRIKVVLHTNRIEATWTPAKMPFCYGEAPTLAHNAGLGDFPELEKTLKHGNRSTIEAQFSSLF